jgi:hypothetical protein
MAAIPVEFQSAFGLAESVNRLKGATRRFLFLTIARESAVGSVSAQRVVLRRVIPMLQNSFKPVFVGRFVERDGRVYLAGQFRMSWAVRVFMTLWFGMLGLALLFSVAARSLPSHSSWVGLLGGIGMATAGVALVTFGKWLSRNDPAWISGVIEGALSAEKPPAFQQRSDGRTQLRLIGAVCLLFAIVLWLPLFVPGTQRALGLAAHPPHILWALSAIDTAVLLFIAYGAFRRELFAWRLGFVFLGLACLQSVLEPLWERSQPKFPLWGEIALILGSLLVTAVWTSWWYTRREYWQREGDESQGPG